MARMHTFSCKADGATGSSDPSYEFTLKVPTNGEDQDLIRRLFGSEEEVYAKAVRTLVVDIQNGGLRERIAKDGHEDAKQWVENWTPGTKRTVQVIEKPATMAVEDFERLGFTPEQVAGLVALGKIEATDEVVEYAAG